MKASPKYFKIPISVFKLIDIQSVCGLSFMLIWHTDANRDDTLVRRQDKHTQIRENKNIKYNEKPPQT